MEYKIEYKIITVKIADNETDIKSPADIVAKLSDDIANDMQENLMIYGLNSQNKIKLKHLIARGRVNGLQCEPADILIPLLHNNLRNLIIVHNHPSGNPTPSEEDVIFTRKIDKACRIVSMSLLDHVILSHGNYFSFKKEALL